MYNKVLMCLFPIFVHAQSWNIDPIGNFDYSQDVNDIWGYQSDDGTEYALVGTYDGTSIVRVNEGFGGLQEVAFIPGDGSIWRDVKTYDHYMYVGTEASQGIQVVDIEDPENAELVHTWNGVTNSHNIFQDDGYLYVVGAGGSDMHILDLSDPAHPMEIGAWSGEYIHDIYVRDDYAYAAGIYTSTMYIIDISDKTNPQTVTSWSYPGMAHACWLTEDSNYLISADETAGGNIKIWDIQDINNINMVSQWTHEGGENKSVHNVFVRDQYLYASYYVFGLVVLDISDPYNPTLAGYYDTYPGSNGLYEGAWGAYPFTESCHTYISDFDSGLHVVDFIGCNSATAQLSYSPGSFDFTLNPDQSASELLSITNSGEAESVLFYDVSIATPSPFEQSGGGPDGFGNFWSDSDLESSIDYEWIDISTDANTQQVTFSSNDGGSGSLSIGFDFQFYENVYSECIINANGWLGFGEDNTEWSNTSIPSEDAPRPAIFGFWDDLNPVNDNCNQYCSGNAYVNADTDRFVAWFDNVAAWWSSNPDSYYDFQIVLYRDGRIQLNYREITGTHSATIGIQDGSGSVGLQVAYNDNYVHNELSIQFARSESVDWLNVSSENNELNGQLSAGETAEFTISADASGLSSGLYDAGIVLNTNVEPNIELPVTLNVLDESSEMTLEIAHMDGWNMIGLPLNVESSNYQFVFPDAINGTLYSFNDGYVQEENLISGIGYWLRMDQAGVTSMTGTEIESLSLQIIEGWNLISGITYSVGLSAIDDPGQLIVPGTIYGYGSSGYIDAEMIESGHGYWLRSYGVGTITLSATGQASDRLLSSTTLEKTHSISINGRSLYFGVEVSDVDRIQYSLPPKPPSGAFDVRFKDGWKYCLQECDIEVSSNVEVLHLSYSIKNEEEWSLISSDGVKHEFQGSGVLNIPTDEHLTLEKKIEIPYTYALHQIYPNPFNPTTTIRYELQYMNNVSIVIYDVRGRIINQLMNEIQGPGEREVTWNARDHFGRSVSAGIYICEIRAGDFVESKKMILMK